MYIAANLTEESVKALKEKISPKHAKVFYHHVTLAFNPGQEIFEKYKDLIGKEIDLQVFGYCHDDRGQAVLVDLDVPVEKQIPHITLSCNQETKPFYSESLVQKKTNYGNVYLKLKAVISIND